ncbi:MAG: sodium:proton antiporter NhaD, partial [Arenimonas sp.]|nr:sodium:proton antiporter NhaD [Arenimonas sp.]
MPPLPSGLVALLLVGLPAPAFAAASPAAQALDLTVHPIGLIALAVFVLAYVLVVLEERIGLRKSKPVLLAAALIWMLIAVYAEGSPALSPGFAGEAFRRVFLEFSELFFFLIVAMSFVAAIGERNVFQALRAELVSRRFTYHSLFWLTGIISFFMSAVLDNLTTALIMSGVILA